MTTTQAPTTTTEPTSSAPFLENFGAVLRSWSPLDGKRNNSWSAGRAYYHGAGRDMDRTPSHLSIDVSGDVIRSGSKINYAQPVTVRISRWHHGFDGPGCFVDSYGPRELPDGARKIVAEQIRDAFSATFSAVFGHPPSTSEDFDAIWLEAGRLDATHSLERLNDDIARKTADRDALAESLADPSWTSTSFGRR